MNLRVLLALACTSAALSAGDVLLRLAPETSSRVVTRLDSSHAAFATAKPVKDEQLASAGWQWTELTATVTGHIPTERLAKDFSIQPGTIIRATREADARVLTVVEDNDKIDVDTTTATAQWTRVRFKKPIPVYFLSADLPQTAAMDVPAPEDLGSGPASFTDPSELPPEKVTWKRIEVDSIYDPQPFEKKRSRPTTILVQETVPVMPAPKPEPKPAAPQALVDEASTSERSAPQRPQASATVGSISLQGVLVREYGDAPYSLQLKSDDSPLTYVDISKVFINDLRPYLNQQLEVNGTVRPVVVGSDERVIQVQTIELVQ